MLVGYHKGFIVRQFLFRPHLWGRNYILNWVFSVQTILSDRYIHRREMWAVSLKIPSSAEYGIKISFWISFFRASCRGLNFCEYYTDFRYFYSHFPEFFPKNLSICYSDLIFWLEFWLNISKFRLFCQKLPKISYFGPIWLNLTELHTQKQLTQSL